MGSSFNVGGGLECETVGFEYSSLQSIPFTTNFPNPNANDKDENFYEPASWTKAIHWRFCRTIIRSTEVMHKLVGLGAHISQLGWL
jgi:hypothetical protein